MQSAVICLLGHYKTAKFSDLNIRLCRAQTEWPASTVVHKRKCLATLDLDIVDSSYDHFFCFCFRWIFEVRSACEDISLLLSLILSRLFSYARESILKRRQIFWRRVMSYIVTCLMQFTLEKHIFVNLGVQSLFLCVLSVLLYV